MDKLLIGTSGYDYPEWRGIFYPENLKRQEFLLYYASIFNALELNNTFYNMPTADRMLGFYEKSGGNLQFSVKANRLLTHEVGADWTLQAKAFRDAVNPLLEKASLCALLFQFPQSFHYTKENRIYLAKLLQEFPDFPLVVEFRHAEWLRPSVLQGLEKRGSSLAFCDMPDLKYLPNNAFSKLCTVPVFPEPKPADLEPKPAVPEPKSAVPEPKSAVPEPVEGPVPPSGSQLFYLRLHGRNAASWYAAAGPENPNGSSRYTYDYSDSELRQFVPVIQNIILTGKKPVVFFNNHPNGSGAKNARRLWEMIEGAGQQN